MEKITIQSQKDTPNGWELDVVVGEGNDTSQHSVTVDKDYAASLNVGDSPVDKIVETSFEFLLAREPKSSILRSFSLDVIEEYFSEYKPVIKKMIEDK